MVRLLTSTGWSEPAEEQVQEQVENEAEQINEEELLEAKISEFEEFLAALDESVQEIIDEKLEELGLEESEVEHTRNLARKK